TDDVLANSVGDFELQARFNMVDTGSAPKAIMGCPNPWPWWFAIRGSTDVVHLLNDGNQADISGWSVYDEDVTFRVTRVGNTYTVYYRLDDEDDWTTLGSDTATAGSGTTSTVYLGATSTNEDTWEGVIHYVRFWVGGNSSTGTLRFDFDPTRDGEIGANTIVSSTTGETWSLGSGASISGDVVLIQTTDEPNDIVQSQPAGTTFLFEAGTHR